MFGKKYQRRKSIHDINTFQIKLLLWDENERANQ